MDCGHVDRDISTTLGGELVVFFDGNMARYPLGRECVNEQVYWIYDHSRPSLRVVLVAHLEGSSPVFKDSRTAELESSWSPA